MANEMIWTPELQQFFAEKLALYQKESAKRRLTQKFTPNNRKEIADPGVADFTYGRIHRKPFRVKASKPPKARYSPGQFFTHDGEVWQLVYMYRTQEAPNVWIHVLEDIPAFKNVSRDLLDNYLTAFGCGQFTPRIVYEEFRNSWDAMSYFSDIACSGSMRVHLTTSNMNQKAKLFDGIPTTVIVPD